MARATILAAAIALLLVAANVVAGAASGFGLLGLSGHVWLALPTTIAALFCLSFIFLYFLHVRAFAKEAARDWPRAAAAPDTARRICAGILPWVGAAMATLSAAYILGGGADTGAVPPAVHLGLALIALAVHLVAAYRTVVFVGMVIDLEDEVEAAGG